MEKEERVYKRYDPLFAKRCFMCLSFWRELCDRHARALWNLSVLTEPRETIRRYPNVKWTLFLCLSALSGF